MITDAVVEAQGLGKSFGGNVVFADLACRIDAGQFILLRGDNASGKTTLLNILTGQLRADKGSISINTHLRHRIRYGNDSWQSHSPESFARCGISRSWQDVRLFPNHTVLDNLSVATQDQLGENLFAALFARRRVRVAEEKNQADSHVLLSKVDIDEFALRKPGTLSLGQSKRVAIARAIRAGARVLFLDEPLSGLDQQGAHDVLSLILQLVTRERVSVVIVEHLFHIPQLLPFADKVWTVANGKLVVEQPFEVQKELRHAPNQMSDWFDELASEGYICSTSSLVNGATLHIARRDPEASVLLEVAGLCVERSGIPVLGDPGDATATGFSLRLRRGDIALLEAPNGWGKSTILETIAGFTRASAGSVSIAGQPMLKLPPWDRALAGLSLVRSSGAGFPSFNVSEAFRLAGAPLPPNLRPFAPKRIGDLSGGQQQLVNIMRTLQNQHAYVRLLDEPFNMLDSIAAVAVKTAIQFDPSVCTMLAMPAVVHRNGPAANHTDSQGAIT